MKIRNLKALLAYAKKKAQTDTANNASSDSDDTPQLVRDLEKDFQITDYTQEKVVLQSLDNPKIQLNISDTDVKLCYDGKEIDITSAWADDFDTYCAAVRQYQLFEKTLDKNKIVDITIEQSKVK